MLFFSQYFDIFVYIYIFKPPICYFFVNLLISRQKAGQIDPPLLALLFKAFLAYKNCGAVNKENVGILKINSIGA